MAPRLRYATLGAVAVACFAASMGSADVCEAATAAQPCGSLVQQALSLGGSVGRLQQLPKTGTWKEPSFAGREPELHAASPPKVAPFVEGHGAADGFFTSWRLRLGGFLAIAETSQHGRNSTVFDTLGLDVSKIGLSRDTAAAATMGFLCAVGVGFYLLGRKSEPTKMLWLPSAALHFFLIETSPILIAACAFTAFAHSIPETLLFGHGNLSASVACLSSVATDAMMPVMEIGGCDLYVNDVLPPRHIGSLIWMLRIWCWLSLAGYALLFVYCWRAFLLDGGHWNFGSFSYVSFCWGLEARPMYKFLAMRMWQSTVAIPAVVVVASACFVGWGAGLHFVLWNIANWALLMVSVHHIVTPPNPVHHWSLTKPTGESTEVDEGGCSVFRRSWTSFVTSNDSFGLVITDALWRAQCGELWHLRELLDGDAESFLGAAAKMQQDESVQESIQASVVDLGTFQAQSEAVSLEALHLELERCNDAAQVEALAEDVSRRLAELRSMAR